MASYFYHVTLKSRLASIKATGLTPGRRRLWKNLHGAQLGSRAAIYVWDDWSSAIRWAAQMEWAFKKPIALLILANPPGPFEPDEHKFAIGHHGFRTETPIPPSSIIEVVPLTTELTQQVVARQAPDPEIVRAGLTARR